MRNGERKREDVCDCESEEEREREWETVSGRIVNAKKKKNESKINEKERRFGIFLWDWSKKDIVNLLAVY